MRHAEAAHYAQGNYSDSERHLTEHGLEQAAKAAKMLTNVKNKFKIKKILSSTYLRARQTADALAELTGLEVEHLPEISLSNTNLEKIHSKIDLLAVESEPDQAVVLVSHIPIVYLLTERFAHKSEQICHFSTANFAVIDYPSGTLLTTGDQLARVN